MSTHPFQINDRAFESAETLWRRGDIAAAHMGFLDLLSRRLSAADVAKPLTYSMTSRDMVAIERLIDTSVILGHFQVADDLLKGMAGLALQAGNRYAADYCLLKRIHLLLERGLLHEAGVGLREMEATIGDIDAIEFTNSGLLRWESSRRLHTTDRAARFVFFSRVYFALGRLLAALGQYQEAIVALERGLHYTGKDAPHLARQADVHLKLALVMARLEKGDLIASRQTIMEVEHDIDEIRHPGLYTQWLELSGKLDLLVGKLGQAFDAFNRVYDFCVGRGYHYGALRAAFNLTHVMIYLNQTRAAKDLLITAQKWAAGFSDKPSFARATFLIALADARSRLVTDSAIEPVINMRSAERLPFVEENTEVQEPLDIEQSDSFLALFEDRALEFHWRLGCHDLEGAIDQFCSIKNTFCNTDSDLIRLRVRVLEAELDYYTGNVKKAEATLSEVRPELRELGLKPELWELQRILDWCWKREGRVETDRDALNKNNYDLLGQMSGTLTPNDQTIFLLNKWTQDEEYIASQINLLDGIKKKAQASRWFSRPWQWWLLMKQLNTLLSHVDSYKDALARHVIEGQDLNMRPGKPFPLWRRLLLHPRNRMTFSFLALPDKVLIFRTGWLSLDYYIGLTTRIELRELVQRWHEITAEIRGRNLKPQDQSIPRGDTIKEAKAAAMNLANSLGLPALFKSLPGRIRALTIVPDDSLHGFPFAAIFYDDKYLIERYALSLAFECKRKKSTPASDARKTALLIGVSAGSAAQNIPPLPGTARELDEVSRWLSSREKKTSNNILHRLAIQSLKPNRGVLKLCRLENHKAKKADVIKNLSSSAFLHVSCHGLFEPNHPDRSGLVLIPAPDEMEVLNLREFSGADLKGLQHATIATCWAADHFILPGRWVISLPETLWRAGAQSVLGCMWEVDDEIAVSFMKRFYECLNCLPRDEALRRTQNECLQGALPGYDNESIPDSVGIDSSNPVYWAGYNLYGDYGELRI